MNRFRNKKILIMGATSQTVPFVTTAREMGIVTYVADHLENSVAKKYADFPLLVNCFDIDKLESIVNKEHIDGIIIGCADILLPAYRELCERTHKYCYGTKEQIRVLNNKKELKKKLKKYNLPTIPEYYVNSKNDADIIPESVFPIFLKPVDNCSSKGMSVCNGKDEFEQCYNKAIGYSRSNTVLIEKYMTCDDISITYTFINGNVYVMSISDRYVNREQKDVGTITNSLIYPSKYTELYFNTTHKKICKMFKDMKMQNGVLTMQAFVDDGEIIFYDPAFRVTGGQGYIFYNYFGHMNQIKMLIEYSLTGQMVTDIQGVNCECNFGSAWADNLVILAKIGEIAQVKGIEDIMKMDGVLNVTQCHFDGDVISGRGTLDQAVARIHLIANTKEDLADLINRILNKIDVIGLDGSSMLMRQFDKEILIKEYK